MDYPDYEVHMKVKGYTGAEAISKWQEMESSGTEHDFKGRKDFEKRFAVSVEDYKLTENVTGDRKDMVLAQGDQGVDMFIQICTKQFLIEDAQNCHSLQ